MNLLRLVSAACLAASFALVSSPSGAAPVGPVQIQPTENLVVQVNGCHSDVRRGYVREFGRTTVHRHQRNCRPVRVSAGSRDCHRDTRRHFLPQYGGTVVHRHVGSNCRVRVLRRHYGTGGRDCVQFGPIRYCVS